MTARPSKRSAYVMVDETDPGFVRFWNSYPRRCSKKEARKVWAEMNPSPELVDRMVAALAWQVPANKWDGVKEDYAPYPASWLNAERWTDEPPAHLRPRAERADDNGHIPPCANRTECIQKVLSDARAKAS